MTQEEAAEDLQAPQNSKDRYEEVEEAEEGPEGSEGNGRALPGNGKGGHGQPSYLGKSKLDAAELQVWHPGKASPCSMHGPSLLNMPHVFIHASESIQRCSTGCMQSIIPRHACKVLSVCLK